MTRRRDALWQREPAHQLGGEEGPRLRSAGEQIARHIVWDRKLHPLEDAHRRGAPLLCPREQHVPIESLALLPCVARKSRKSHCGMNAMNLQGVGGWEKAATRTVVSPTGPER